tara:strand:- start:12030 stop:13412 length:1383 start_codon:yes stop_codon:yes gene_type:complete
MSSSETDNTIIKQLADYFIDAQKADLPDNVALKTKHHILDTLAAMVSGTTLPPGEFAIKYAKLQGTSDQSQIIGTNFLTNAVTASLANGMLAHSDETDDSHAASGTHPGCTIIPPALAMGEKNQTNGKTFLNSIALGYDMCARFMRAFGGGTFQRMHGRGFSSHAIGGVFGAAAAAGTHIELDEKKVRYLLSYTTQQASGITAWQLDLEHIEKAFDFAGMPCRSGATAATMVEAGFSGVWDVIEGQNNFFDCFASEHFRSELIKGLGSHYEIMDTNIKKYCVGSPIQAPVDALLNIVRDHEVNPSDLNNMTVYLAHGDSRLTSDAQTMPDINLRYLLAVSLLDRGLSFEAGHDFDRMSNDDVVQIMNKIQVETDPSLITPESPRQGVVEFNHTNGEKFRNHVVVVKGAMEDPLSTEEVETKERPLLEMVIGKDKTDQLIDTIWNLESLGNVRDLRELLRP